MIGNFIRRISFDGSMAHQKKKIAPKSSCNLQSLKRRKKDTNVGDSLFSFKRKEI